MLKMVYCEETKRFQVLLTQTLTEKKEVIEEMSFLFDEKKKVLEKNGFSFLGYKKSDITLPEYENIIEKEKELNEKYKDLEHNEKVILMETRLKTNDLKQNITADFIEVLESLKMRDIVNLTDIRKEKIKNELLKKESFSKENRLYLYKNNYCFSLSINSPKYCCSGDLEVNVYDFDFKNKPEKVSVLKDSEYLDKADDFVAEYDNLRKELESYNKKLTELVENINSKFDTTIYLKRKAELEEL